MQNQLNLNGVVDLRRQLNKSRINEWVDGIIEADIKRGRKHDEFLGDNMYEETRAIVPKMNKAGFDVYQAAGNVFLVRYKDGKPTAIHIRPLAQRVVKPIFTG